MKETKIKEADFSSVYRTQRGGMIKAPREQKDSVRGTKTVSDTDLRTKKGR